MVKSIRDIVKKQRGRKRTTGLGLGILIRLHSPLIEAVDAFIATQPDPKPSRPEVIRLALRDWLASLGHLPIPTSPEPPVL